MPFIKGDPKTIAAGKRGGKTGTKHLSTVEKGELKKLTSKAGIESGRKRREKAALKRAEKKYLEYEPTERSEKV